MTQRHPYEGIAYYRNWRRAAGVANHTELDPMVNPKFAILPSDKVATSGSCFAQHVARHLKANGFNILIAEEGPSFLTAPLAREFQYGVYATRSGNIYTSRQLRQLLERAYGLFDPGIGAWTREDGMLCDPFRPQVATYESESEFRADRAFHLAKVREMVENLSVFVFTLGLTEAWTDETGAIYPLAPGVAGGTYDPTRHRFLNFSVDEVVDDLRAAIAFIKARNPSVKFVLTVSPVPLMATGIDRHVLVSTTHSKAILRVAAQATADADDAVDYFPSYEIITAPHTRGRYFGPDARSVNEAGVNHVMRVFLKHYAPGATSGARPGKAAAGPKAARGASARHTKAVEDIVEVLCDEEALDDTRR
ncbi:GSCFA domain-containing protein [Acuticoccus sp. M5D2P5]|uniref:GSCFA domain-containing protein n=1 Tax=Acuticoccus kalidii TaxID=2910977 RepID=UPI001F21C634|nr:GSCFA domain-containing protein [Acuticoccus kalidii]MCF3931954.1 GSCFA domain-containing protein [Acuticoccus kalidii]